MTWGGKTARRVVVLFGGLLLGVGACGEDGGGSGGTSSGTTSTTSTGGAGGAGATGGGTPAGVSGDPCEPGTAMPPEERFRATCVMTVEHPDWGQCAGDPPASEAIDHCLSDTICDDCPYLWYVDAFFGTLTGCLHEVADLRCCLLAQPDPALACNDNEETAYVDAQSVTVCSAEYDTFVACSQ